MAKKAETIDITKTGPQGYRQLQSANNDPFEGIRPQPISPHSRYANRPQMVKSPLADTGTAWGESMWDDDSANAAEFERLSDIRAENQPWFAKVGAGLAKGTILAGTTLVDGTVGLIAGIGTAISEGKWSGLWNNDVSVALNKLNEAAESWLPNYYTQDEMENPLALRNIFSANFLGDKFLKNIGFTVGAFYSGGIWTGAMKAAKLPQLIGRITKATGAPKAVTSLLGSTISAYNEGRIEGLNAALDFESKYRPAIEQQYRDDIERITAEYEANKGKELVRVGGDSEQWIDPAYAKYQQDMAKLKSNYDQAMAKLEEDMAKVGNKVLLYNLPILTASNYYQFGRLYAKGFDTARRAANVVGRAGEYVARGTSKVGRVGRVVGGGIMEGTEEVEQQGATNIAQHYYATDFNNFYRKLNDPDAKEETQSWINSFAEGIAQTVGDESTWEQFLVGGLTGLLGMPSFRSMRNQQGKLQSPITLEGNMFSRYKEMSQQARRDQQVADALNERVNSPEFRNYYMGLTRHNSYQNDMDDAVSRDDKFDFKNAEHNQLVSDIVMFSNAGKLDDLKALVNETYDVSPENLASIRKNVDAVGLTKDEKGNSLSDEELAASLTKKRDEILSTIEEYNNNRKEIDASTGQVFTDEQLEELTWMKTQLGNWAKRATEMSSEIKESIGPVIGRLDEMLRANKAVMDYEGQKSAELTENYRKADKNSRTIQGATNVLNTLRNMGDDTMAAALAMNNDLLKGIKDQINKVDDSVLSPDAKKSTIQKLDDLAKLGNASKAYQQKFAEYLLNPKKIDEAHAKVDEETTKETINKERSKSLDSLNNTATFGDVDNLINNGEVINDDLDKSTSQSSKDYKKANLWRRKAIEAINASDNPHKKELVEAINKRFAENGNYDDLVNERLVTDFGPTVSTWDSKEQESFENDFFNFVRQARDKVNSGTSQKKDVKNTKNGTKAPEDAGKDGVAQPPTSGGTDLSALANKAGLAGAKDLVTAVNNYLKDPENELLRRRVMNIIGALGQDPERTGLKPEQLKSLDSLIQEAAKLIAPEPYDPGTSEEVLGEYDKSFDSTPVTGVMKSIVPRFDLDAKKDGILIPFVGEGRNQGYSYVYKKLTDIDSVTKKSAFDYVDEGNVSEGDELEVRYEPANEGHPELLALYHKGVLVNYMNTDENVDGVKELKDKLKNGGVATVRVSKIMNGKFAYVRGTTQSIGSLLGTDNAVLGVMKNRSMQANTDKPVEPVFDEANSDGRVYLLLPNAKGSLTPQRVYIRHLNAVEFNLDNENGPIATELKQVIRKLAELGTAKNVDEAFDNLFLDLNDLLYFPDSFHLNIIHRGNETILQVGFADRDGNRQNRNLLLNRQERQAIFAIGADTAAEEGFTADPDVLYGQIVNALYEANLPFNVKAKKLTGKNSQEYANRLRDSNVIFTYLTSKTMQGSWFLLNEKPNSKPANDSFARAKASQDAKGGTRVMFNGQEYFVRTGMIFDQAGNTVDLGDNAQEVLDLAWIKSAYGNNYYGVNQHNGQVLIVDQKGKRAYDRKTGKYLPQAEVAKLESILENRKSQAENTAKAIELLAEQQKMVKRLADGRPDTTKNSKGESVYYILEDGQYIEYTRVHGVIGSNYIGPNRGNDATDRGSQVDDIARQFFIDPTSVVKPDDMSEEAFRSLLRGLGKFKSDAENRGLELRTDRIVVFNKYPDGRRIAGELDVFAYNPYTGEVQVFDFKTSKYSTKDTSFSKVINPRLFTRSTKDQYTLQLSAYAKLIEDSLGVPVSHLTVVPFQIKYSKDGIVKVFPENYVPLNYVSTVFNTKPTSQQGTPSQGKFRTIKGQYVTLKRDATGNVVEPEFHQADMQELFTVKQGTFYLANENGKYRLVLPNGRSMSLQDGMITPNMSEMEVRNQITDFINSENVARAITGALQDDYLKDSPYGSSIEVTQPGTTNTPKKKVYYIEGATSYDDEWHVLIKPIQIFWQNHKRDPQIGEIVREQYGKIAPVIGKVRESGIKHNYEEVVKALKGTYYEEVLQYIKVKEEPSSTSNPTLQVVFNEGDKVTYTVNGDTGTGTVVKVSSTGKTITVKRDRDGKEIQYSPTLLTKSTQVKTPEKTPSNDATLAEKMASVAKLQGLKPTSGTHNTKQEEALQQREKDKKASVDIDFSTPTGRTQLAHKSWSQLTEAEKDYVRLTGMDDAQMQVFWDSVDATQREQFIPTCK